MSSVVSLLPRLHKCPRSSRSSTGHWEGSPSPGTWTSKAPRSWVHQVGGSCISSKDRRCQAWHALQARILLLVACVWARGLVCRTLLHASCSQSSRQYASLPSTSVIISGSAIAMRWHLPCVLQRQLIVKTQGDRCRLVEVPSEGGVGRL